MKNFRPVDRDTGFLMPPSVDEWLPEKHLARFVVDMIASLDLRAMIGSYRGSGEASYHPTVLLGILVYGYATGVFSSRKLERATHDSVAFRFVADGHGLNRCAVIGLGCDTQIQPRSETMPVKVEPTASLAGLSPVCGKPIIARFDGGQLSSDGGLLALREVERRLGIADRLAACIDDPRAPERVRHGVADILRFRMLMIAAGYEDGNDADSLRHDPVFKLALDHLPDGAALCSQPTISRLENLPGPRALLRMARAMVGLYCASFRQVPRRIILDVDDTFDAVHGGQQLRLFNAYYDEYGFQPIVVFDGEGRPVAAMLRPACRPNGAEARAFLRRLVREIRSHWPRVEILIRADSHYCAPEVLDFCRAQRLDFILGVASTTTLRRHVQALEQSTTARYAAAGNADKQRRYTEFYDGAGSWSRVERIIARVEAGPDGVDTRFVVTNLNGDTARRLYERTYCARGQAENHVKAWKRHLAADRTSCSRSSANQLRLMLHTGAYWLLWSLRSLMPKRSSWRVAQFDTLRLRLVKLAARVVAQKTRVMLHLPSAYPAKAIMRLALERMPRLIC